MFIRRNRSLLAILLLSVLLRAGAAFYLGNQVTQLPGISDQVSYHTLALRLLDGHGFTFATDWWPATRAGEPTAHWSYLYTFYLLAVYSLFGAQALAARLLQALIVGILQPWLVYALGRSIFSERVGLLAAAFTAVYAYFIYYAAALMTEPFFITAILASFYLAIRLARAVRQPEPRRANALALALGLSLAAAVLLRQLFLLLIPFVFFWIWWQQRRQTILPLLLAAVLIVVTILPFTLFNYQRFDRFVLLNTNAGYALFYANHPIYGSRFEPILVADANSYRRLIPREYRDLDEAALDQALLREGIGFVLDEPLRFARLSLSRVPVYFMFWPTADSGTVSNIARVASFGLLWPFMLLGLVVALRRRGRLPDSGPLWLLLSFAAVYTVIHILSWTLIRYRLPVDAIMLLFAACGLLAVQEQLQAVGLRKSNG